MAFTAPLPTDIDAALAMLRTGARTAGKRTVEGR
jgi:hypothetical protein